MPVLPLSNYPTSAWSTLILEVMFNPQMEGEGELVEAIFSGAALMKQGFPNPGRLAEYYFQQNSSRFQSGNIGRAPLAGLILLYTLAQAEAKAPRASLNNTFDTLADILPGKIKRGASRTEIWKSWDHFSPVAHLWAMHLGCELTVDICTSKELMLDWLSNSESLRLQGEAFRPARSKVPILDASKSWNLPVNLKLPESHFVLPASEVIIEGLKRIEI